VVINPGNPTSHVLDENNMREIVHFCRKENICLLADEVYQENIWAAKAKFVSFRQVAYDMDVLSDPENGLQMISFHSVSKGFLGECGLRGGYFELLNIPTAVRQELYKLCSISLCSNTIGQIATGLMVAPPRPGEPSFDTYKEERDAILSSLRRRAQVLSASLNQLEGVSCNSVDGALYAFPTITLPGNEHME
jgi:alanine transaminase